MPVNRFVRRCTIAAAGALVAMNAAAAPSRSARETRPAWLPSAVIYGANPEIFSPTKNLAGVTAQLPRLRSLGITAVWLMPITPRGKPFEGHPAFESPYCVHDYESIDPRYGTPDDLKQLVRTAHRLGIKVLLDAVLNHTAWDNPLIRQHPEFYVHTDGNVHDPKSVSKAFDWADVAQLDYGNHELWTYMHRMLRRWVTEYDIDGFRFDSADNPYGSGRKVPAAFWQSLRPQLEAAKPEILMLGECQDPELATTPFQLDYGWHMDNHFGNGALDRAILSGNTAGIQSTWESDVRDFPAGILHMSMQDNWDFPSRDVNRLGAAGAMLAAVFNFTIDGVPFLYNGMEAGNTTGTINPHVAIDWSAHPAFPPFYRQLIALRRRNPALQQGSLTWVRNDSPSRLLTYVRSGGGKEFLIAINVSGSPVTGAVVVPGRGWREVTPVGAPGGRSHSLPPNLTLQAKDFAIFERPLSGRAH